MGICNKDMKNTIIPLLFALFLLPVASFAQDTDLDGLDDTTEATIGTDPMDQDTDDDGLSDGEEYHANGSATGIVGLDPLMLDTDGDGVQDGTELGLTSGWTGDPWNGIAGTEIAIFIVDADPSTTTDPLDDDSDDDGMLEGEEDNNFNGEVKGLETDPNLFDTDGDTIGDGLELGVVTPTGTGTDMNLFIPDADPSTTTNPLRGDTDQAGLWDNIEDWNVNGAIDTGESDPNDPADDTLMLRIDPIYEGGDATFHIYGGNSRTWLYLCYSLVGAGPSNAGAGLVLELSTPIGQLAPFQLNSRGEGSLGPLPVPATILIDDQVWFQGVEFDMWSTPNIKATNMVPVTVEQMPGPPPPPRPDMVLIAGGTFEMGDHAGVGWSDEQPVHSVTLDAFYMDVYEVSNTKFADYLNNSNVSVSGSSVYQVGGAGQEICYLSYGLNHNGTSFGIDAGKDNHPVVYQTWYGAALYCNYLSAADGRTPCYDETTFACDYTADGYRLPTEAEWEYASRGGEHNPYYQYPWGSNSITSGDANYDWNIGTTVDVGNYAANGYGLYDMAGNVWEWTGDWYGTYSASAQTNPTGPASGSARVSRGGGWNASAVGLRCADRYNYWPATRRNNVGFRVLAVH